MRLALLLDLIGSCKRHCELRSRGGRRRGTDRSNKGDRVREGKTEFLAFLLPLSPSFLRFSTGSLTYLYSAAAGKRNEGMDRAGELERAGGSVDSN